MHGDAGVKQAVAKAQLHEHQNSGEADACQSNRQTYGLANQHQGCQWNPAPPPKGSDHGVLKRAITFKPES